MPAPIRFLCKTLLIVASVLTCGVGASLAWLWFTVPDPLPGVLSWSVSPVLLDKDGVLIHARLSEREEWCLPVPLSEMGHWLPKVLVAVEDKRFYRHSGVDLIALARAGAQNILAGRVVSGASTITSQLVRLSKPRPRTMGTKIHEFVGAWKLERELSKEQILELYLNRAPFGGPIRGVEAAARMYYGKRAADLSLGEAALLVGLLKGPTAYRPDRNPEAAQARRRQIIGKVARETGFPPDLTSLALAEPLPRFRPSMPARVWHMADIAFKTLPRRGGIVRSTLDMRVQSLLERSLMEQLAGADAGITAAGIVVDNATASIIAYVGNVRFDPSLGRQWVDCAAAPRSPGSTLKPFVYLAAIEEGYIIPASLLADTPLRLGGEAPRNFDLHYRGPVSARTALSGSLNAPAVRVLRMLGVRKALNLMRGAGFTYLSRKDEDYGDSLVLGAGEVSLLQLARGYTALAALGRDRPLLFTRPRTSLAGARPEAGYLAPMPEARVDLYASLPSGLASVARQRARQLEGKEAPERRLYSEAACFLIADILKDPSRFPFLMQLMQARENSPMAFKTGTSFGLRDAWTAAYTPPYTVLVWFGKAEGGPDQRLVGLRMAAPAALRVLRNLTREQPPERAWYEKPAGVGEVRICSLSGAAPSPFCPATRTAFNVRKVWRTVPCAMHVLRDGNITLLWPPELEDFNKKRFSQDDHSRALLIVSPMPGARYLITPGVRNQPIALKVEGASYPVHWYVNGEYLGVQEREDLPLYWVPTGGGHNISVLDAMERVTSINMPVTDLGALREEALPLLE
ncbi:transglycosylase domain-containing protein [Desulfovibrio sp. OttesenSCG-928-A18]|nr:transglycosylase domain-containing protein [Desulfovibrio sp. OttesenSCG-928-A18]